MKLILVITSIFLYVLIGCKKENDSEDIILPIDEVQETRKKLIGTWIELSPCNSCHLFEFTEQDSIIETFIRMDLRVYYYFQITAPDSIKVLRDWKIDEHRKETTHKLLFHSDNTLTLIQFLAVDYGTGFADIKLHKTNKK
jgi:hypothetical protein